MKKYLTTNIIMQAAYSSVKTCLLLTASCCFFQVVQAQEHNLNTKLLRTFIQQIRSASAIVYDTENEKISNSEVKLTRIWHGDTCRSFIQNKSNKAVKLSSIVLFDLQKHALPVDAIVYGEGFQMLHQNGGTLNKRENIGNYTDIDHYKIPDVNGMPTAYGAMEISVGTRHHLLLGFTSCNRFIGRIAYQSQRMQVSFDAEGLTLQPGEKWNLETFILLSGNSRAQLFNQLAAAIQLNYPRISSGSIPTGWCSWYCYGPSVTDNDINANLDSFSRKIPVLKYIQIDDGYQPFMGDWLDDNPVYGNIKQTLKNIRQKGFEPAIWVAPFIAEGKSRIFKEHPDWFVKDKNGKPLNSATVGFGGWRNGPWYALDGTNPAVQKHLESVFKTMREQWGVNYFKMDANYWGAIHKGVHYDTTASRVEAYRRGMKAIIRGCDDRTVLLGCNAPIWPSLGLVTAMRTSGDINRDWNTIKQTAFENLHRAWQNGKLWDADPDCVLLANDTAFSGGIPVKDNEWIFHATAIHATGGLILSGDKAANIGAREMTMLKKLLVPTGKGANFNDASMQTGVTEFNGVQYYYFFNWSETETIDLKIKLNKKSLLTDYWSDEELGVFENDYIVKKLPPHSARLIAGKEIK